MKWPKSTCGKKECYFGTYGTFQAFSLARARTSSYELEQAQKSFLQVYWCSNTLTWASLRSVVGLIYHVSPPDNGNATHRSRHPTPRCPSEPSPCCSRRTYQSRGRVWQHVADSEVRQESPQADQQADVLDTTTQGHGTREERSVPHPSETTPFMTSCSATRMVASTRQMKFQLAACLPPIFPYPFLSLTF